MGYYYLVIIRSENFDSKQLFKEFSKFFILGICIYILINQFSFFLIENIYDSIFKVIIWVTMFIIILIKLKWFPKLKNIL